MLETIKDWRKKQVFRENHIIDQLLPETPGEYMLVAGMTGIGKSTLVSHMCYCIATGHDFFGFKTQSSTIGYIAFEGCAENLSNKLGIIGKGYKDSGDRLRFGLENAKSIEKYPDWYEEKFTGCKVAVLDNLRQITGSRYMDPTYAAEFIKRLQELFRKIGCSLIITHHIKKKDPRMLFEPGDIFSLKGATEYADAATTVLMLERKRQGRLSNGKFAKSPSDAITVYFSKTRIARDVIDPIDLEKVREAFAYRIVAP